MTRKREVELESELAHDYSTNDCSTTLSNIGFRLETRRIFLARIVPDIFGPDHGNIRLGSVVLVRFGVRIFSWILGFMASVTEI